MTDEERLAKIREWCHPGAPHMRQVSVGSAQFLLSLLDKAEAERDAADKTLDIVLRERDAALADRKRLFDAHHVEMVRADKAEAQVAALREALAEISNECMYPINGRIGRVRRIARAALDGTAQRVIDALDALDSPEETP